MKMDAVYSLVQQIPVGNVATYGQIAELLGNRHLAQSVGNALHNNPDPSVIPCHRVVNSKGELAENYAFGGWQKQKERLLAEGIKVQGKRVNLSIYQWNRG